MERVGTESVDCVICGRGDPCPYEGGMYAIDGHGFDLVRCRGCGMVYVDPRPDGPTLARMYDDPSYYTEGYNLGVENENYFDRRDELLELYDRDVARIEEEIGRVGELMELGAAGGFFLEAARRRGWGVRGVEVSPVAARYARAELGLDVFEGLLQDAPYDRDAFDLTVADNVLEHMSAPRAVLEDLYRLLRPEGHLLVIVPTYVNSIYFRTLKRIGRLVPRRLVGPQLARILKLDQERDAGYPYHVIEFDRSTLTRLLTEVGFEIESSEGSVPFPAHLFKRQDLALHERLLRGIFRLLDRLMRAGWIPGARLRVLAQKPTR